jgi:hypothetical protein
MLIIDHFDAALQQSQINNDIISNSEKSNFDVVDKLLLQLNKILIDDSMVQKCLSFAKNNQQLIKNLKLFENKLKTILTKFLKEKKMNFYDKHRLYLKNISSKIELYDSKLKGIVFFFFF